MTTVRAILRIPGDRTSATIVAPDESVTYFDGNEDQALRISFCVPRFMGGDMYTVSEGHLFERGGVMCLRIEDGAGMGNDIEIEFDDKTVLKVAVTWN